MENKFILQNQFFTFLYQFYFNTGSSDASGINNYTNILLSLMV